MKGLTGKQKNIVEFIEDFTSTMEMAPTIYEIAEHFGIKTSTVFAHIRALQKKSVLKRSSKARSISLVKPRKKSRLPAGARSVPVMEAGDAGLEADPSSRGLICDAKLFSDTLGGKDIFAFHVNGQEFGMGFVDGDMLLIKPPAGEIAEGDLLLTLENGKPALRSCSRIENGILELQSGKPGKQKLCVKRGEAPVRGVVIGLQRSL